MTDKELINLVADLLEDHQPDGSVRQFIDGTNTSAEHSYCTCSEYAFMNQPQHVATLVVRLVKRAQSGKCWCGDKVGRREPGDRNGMGCHADIHHDWLDQTPTKGKS